MKAVTAEFFEFHTGADHHRALQDGRRVAEGEVFAHEIARRFNRRIMAHRNHQPKRVLAAGDGFGDQPHAALVVRPDIGHRREVGDVHASVSHLALRGIQVRGQTQLHRAL